MALYGFTSAKGAQLITAKAPWVNEYHFDDILRLNLELTGERLYSFWVLYRISDKDEEFDVEVRFAVVGALQLPMVQAGGLLNAPAWEIADVTSRGMEDVTFQVRDVEDNVPTFFCSEIHISPMGPNDRGQG